MYIYEYIRSYISNINSKREYYNWNINKNKKIIGNRIEKDFLNFLINNYHNEFEK